MKVIFETITVGLLIVAYLTTIYGIMFKNDKSNFVTFLLWTIIDAIALYGILHIGQQSVMLWLFVIGSGAVALTLFFKRQFAFGATEIFISGIVIACLVISQTESPVVVIWANGLGIFFAGVPYYKYLRDATAISMRTKFIGNLFLAAMVTSEVAAYIGGTDLIIPGICILFWIIACGIAISKPETEEGIFFN